MASFAFSVTRLVPLLLLLSVLLIVARVLRDRVGGAAGRAAFVMVIAIAALVACGVLLQTGTAVVAHETYSRRAWRSVDQSYRAYTILRGRVSRTMAYEWGIALMHGAQWTRATTMFERTGTSSPRGLLLSSDVTLLIGECLYYSGDLNRAEVAIRVARRAARGEARDYFLGRIAERKGRTADAARLYAMSIAITPGFYPGVYHHARLLAASGEAAAAAAELDRFAGVNDPTWREARSAAGRGTVPRDVEFYVLES